MKKIIDGRKYDTDTAKEIGYDSYSNSMDFHWWEETLYRKANGEYFLHGRGGPMSHYARQVEQNSWSGGQRIEPMTWAEARKWAEDHMSADEYEAEFGEVEEGDAKTKPTMLTIPANVLEQGKRAAAIKGVSFSAYVSALIEADQTK